MPSERRPEMLQENTLGYNSVYDRLVKDENDILGQIAYAIYKSHKKAFIIRKQEGLGLSPGPREVVDDYVLNQTDEMLNVYKSHAEKLARAFLDASYGKQLDQEMKALRRALLPRSWWYGVGQSIAASFLFVLAGFILLRAVGSWEKLLVILFGSN